LKKLPEGKRDKIFFYRALAGIARKLLQIGVKPYSCRQNHLDFPMLGAHQSDFNNNSKISWSNGYSSPVLLSSVQI
jgi:hypothetical protein